MTSAAPVVLERNVPLVEVLDRVIDKGVVVQGDAVLSVADVDLIYLGVRLVLCSVDRLGRPVPGAAAPVVALSPAVGLAAAPQVAQPHPPAALQPAPAVPPPPLSAAAPDDSARGLAQLVLTLMELLRELMERQAIRRVDNGTLTDEEIDRMGQHFEQIAARMQALKTLFGLSDDDLNLDLGPLGKLLD